MADAGKQPAVVFGSFDQLLRRELRFLEEAARRGPLHVQLWSDDAVARRSGKAPKFPEAERLYVLEAIRYVDRVTVQNDGEFLDRPAALETLQGSTIVVDQSVAMQPLQARCEAHGVACQVVTEETLQQVPAGATEILPTKGKRVLVTGCYDWFHSGHVRFFEEVSELGQLFVVVGHDVNIRLLKGEGHPMFPAVERRYITGSVRHVHQALVSSGEGWLDAEPEIERIRPDTYAVNEDGDRPEKRDYCQAHGIEYRVLKRTPKEGLPRRQSTDLRGF